MKMRPIRTGYLAVKSAFELFDELSDRDEKGEVSEDGREELYDAAEARVSLAVGTLDDIISQLPITSIDDLLDLAEYVKWYIEEFDDRDQILEKVALLLDGIRHLHGVERVDERSGEGVGAWTEQPIDMKR